MLNDFYYELVTSLLLILMQIIQPCNTLKSFKSVFEFIFEQNRQFQDGSGHLKYSYFSQ